MPTAKVARRASAVLARGHDHARVGNGKAHDRDHLEKIGVADGVRRPGCDVGPHRRLDARKADGVRARRRTSPPDGECAASSRGSRSASRRARTSTPMPTSSMPASMALSNDRRAPIVVALGAFQVNRRIGGAVISLLEKLEGADVRFLQLPEALCRLRSQIHIDAPDLAGADLACRKWLRWSRECIESPAAATLPRRQPEPACDPGESGCASPPQSLPA